MRLSQRLPDSLTLVEAVELHQRLRFDPEPVAEVERKRLEEMARQLESEIRHP
jgi:hypothetical protein